jgi:hypothetical protein
MDGRRYDQSPAPAFQLVLGPGLLLLIQFLFPASGFRWAKKEPGHAVIGKIPVFFGPG